MTCERCDRPATFGKLCLRCAQQARCDIDTKREEVNPMPDVIGVIEKNVNEEIRVDLCTYKGFDLVGCRIWAKDQAGDFLPTKKGLTVRATVLPEVLALLHKAEGEARKRGWIEATTAADIPIAGVDGDDAL